MPIRDRLKHYPRAYWAARRARATATALLPPKQFAGVPGRIHRNDTMMTAMTAAAAGAYNSTGAQAAAFIGAAAPTAAEVLDLGSGYGRVLRHLVRQYPSARFTACDIELPAVRFCATEFGAVPVVSSARLELVDFPTAPYDVVWMGSLLTHLDAAANVRVMHAIARLVRPSATLAFSTHGPELVGALERYGPGLAERRADVDHSLAGGFAYVSYPHYTDGSYGVSFHTASFVDGLVADALGSSSRIAFEARGWGEHQDLHAFQVDPIA